MPDENTEVRGSDLEGGKTFGDVSDDVMGVDDKKDDSDGIMGAAEADDKKSEDVMGGDDSESSKEEKKDEKTSEVKAPESYEEFKAPEGIELNKEAVEAVVPIFKELNLTQEQAQKLIDSQSAFMLNVHKQQEQEVQNFIDKRNKEWREAITSDPEYEKKKVDVNRLISLHDKNGAFAEFMKEYKLQSCKPIYDLLASVGAHFSEDSLVMGEGKDKVKSPSYMNMNWAEVK